MNYANPKNILVEIEWAEAALRRAREDEVEAILAREAAEERLGKARKALLEAREQGLIE